MSLLDATPRGVSKWFRHQKVRHWSAFLVVSGIVWTFVPVNFLLFFPVVLFWIVICVWIATFIMALWVACYEDD